MYGYPTTRPIGCGHCTNYFRAACHSGVVASASENSTAGRILIRLLSEDLTHQALWGLFNLLSKAFLMLAYVPCNGFYNTCFWWP